MPAQKKIKKKKALTTLQLQQRTLLWTMLGLSFLASMLLFFLSWQFSRLKILPSFWQDRFLPALFQGEVLSEQGVANIPASDPSFEKLSFVSAPDGLSFAYILKNENRQQLIINERAEPFFDNISFMTFSPDSQSFAYIAKEGKKEVAVINGEKGRSYDWIFVPRFFSPDSRYFIYKARRENKDVLVINNQESRAYDRIYEPIISSDKQAVIFFALDGDKLWRGSIPLDFDK